MRNHGKKTRKALSALTAACLILGSFRPFGAIYYYPPYEEETETEEETGIIIVRPPQETEDSEDPTDELPSPIIVITAATEETTPDPYAVDPFNPSESPVNPFDPTETELPGIIVITSETSDTSSSEFTDDISESTPESSVTNESSADSSTPSSSDVETTVPDTPAPRLALTYYTFNLEIGQAVQLYWYVENGGYEAGTARYYSDNTAVASINEAGVITAGAAGSAVITVRVGELSASAAVHVAAPIAEAEGISVNETSHTLKIGENVYIQASVIPAEAADRYTLSFYSDDPNVAEADPNGIVTARSAGEADITVSCDGTVFSETVHITVVNEEMIYEKARLDGCLYDGVGAPVEGTAVHADGIIAVTDKNGYFSFGELDKKEIVIQIADNEQAACVYGLYGDSTVCLLYTDAALECFSGYEEMSERFTVSAVSFDAPAKSLHVGEIYIPYYQYEPKDAAVTQVLYISSDENIASVDQNGVITARSIGEVIITLILNGGQAQTFFTLTVDPEETGKYTALIASVETAVLLAAAAAAAVIYRRYKKKAADDEDYDE
ncbi:MAG: Ig-like domain-containing protein [Bacteroides sp.]|nr:Ig-like domain-containing protein [Bacteroides sp.]